jgi:hypothetical protein
MTQFGKSTSDTFTPIRKKEREVMGDLIGIATKAQNIFLREEIHVVYYKSFAETPGILRQKQRVDHRRSSREQEENPAKIGVTLRKSCGEGDCINRFVK